MLKRNIKPYNSGIKLLPDIAELQVRKLHSNYDYSNDGEEIQETKKIRCYAINYTESFNNIVGEFQNNSIEYIKVTMHEREWSNKYNFLVIDDVPYRYENGQAGRKGYLDIIFSYRGD